MLDSAQRQEQNRQQIETELLEVLRQRQQEWCSATGKDRDSARQRFMAALHVFNSLILYGKLPEQSQSWESRDSGASRANAQTDPHPPQPGI